MSLKSSSRAVSTRKWLWGDKRLGYSTVYIGPRSREPFRVEVWLKREIHRTENFRTAAEAEHWAMARKRRQMGDTTPAQARRAYGL